MNAEMLADPCTEPRCNALIGELCVNVHTGEQLVKLAAHNVRIKASGRIHAPIPSAELRRGD